MKRKSKSKVAQVVIEDPTCVVGEPQGISEMCTLYVIYGIVHKVKGYYIIDCAFPLMENREGMKEVSFYIPKGCVKSIKYLDFVDKEGKNGG